MGRRHSAETVETSGGRNTEQNFPIIKTGGSGAGAEGMDDKRVSCVSCLR